MAELPKSVIERMKAQATPQQHPDADLLTAFSEQALTGRERETVLAHLAACAACRETAALASPQPAAEQPEMVLAPWYRRPQIFAWAGTLATLALVGALLLNYGQNRYSTPMVTDATSPKAPTSSMGKTDTTKAAENKPAEAPVQVMNGAPGTLTKNTKNEAQRRDTDVAKLEREQKKQPSEERAMKQAGASLHAAPPPPMQAPEKDQKVLDGGPLRDQYRASKEPVAKSAPAPSVAAAAPSANAVAERQETTVTAQGAAVESTAAQSDKTANLATRAAVGGGLSQGKAKAALALPPIRWSLSDKGKLLSSADSGRTWQPALPKETTVFRALAVVGNEVWAGGSGAVILHSADRGLSWIRQVLPGAYADVVSLQFDDLQHGLARTADGMAWVTADAGQHWSKR